MRLRRALRHLERAHQHRPRGEHVVDPQRGAHPLVELGEGEVAVPRLVEPPPQLVARRAQIGREIDRAPPLLLGDVRRQWFDKLIKRNLTVHLFFLAPPNPLAS